MSKKVMGALLLCLILALTACAPKGEEPTAPAGPTDALKSTPPVAPVAPPTATPEPPPPAFTNEEFPTMDGSTSTKPMMDALATALLKDGEEELWIYTSKTTRSYQSFISGRSDADILLAAAPNQETLDYKEHQGFQWDMAPFADEGFVFVVNKDNPVDSLTVDQLRDIYSGAITNWSEVGGNDLDIVPFQRNQGAGSQTLMEELVMGDTPMTEAPAGYLQGDMGELMSAVRSFDGTASAIGYSVYYYANDMKMAGGLKLLQVDGVAPSDETIRSGAYPLRTHYYAVIRADEPQDSPTRVLYDWLLSAPGQRLVGEAGYVPVLAGAEYVPVSEEGGSGAISMVERRWYPGYTPDLIPLEEGYGSALVPYVGGRTDVVDNYYSGGTSLGLMTTGGTVVTDPEFFDIDYLGPLDEPPTMILLTGMDAMCALADIQGRWYTGLIYRAAQSSTDGVFLAGDSGCVLMDLSGAQTRAWSWADLGLVEMPEWWQQYNVFWEPGMPYFRWENGLVDLGEGRGLDTRSGAIVEMPPEVRDGDGGLWSMVLEAGGGQTWRVEFEGWMDVIRAYGPDGQPLDLPGGLSWTLDRHSWTPSGWLYAVTDEGTAFFRNGTFCTVPGWAGGTDVVAGLVSIRPTGEQTSAVYRLSDGACVIPAGKYNTITVELDPVTLEPYYLCTRGEGTDAIQICLDAAFNVRYTYRPEDPGRPDYRKVTVCGGLLSAETEASVRIWDQVGTLVFSRPFYLDLED